MKPVLFAFALAAILPATITMRQAEPAEYPPDVLCSPKGNIDHGKQTDITPCHCQRHDPSPGCDDPSQTSHDNACKQWCHEDQHCACRPSCDSTILTRPNH